MVGRLGRGVRVLWKWWIWVRWLVGGVLPWRVEGEKLEEELGLGYCYSSVRVVGEAESEETSCIAV